MSILIFFPLLIRLPAPRATPPSIIVSSHPFTSTSLYVSIYRLNFPPTCFFFLSIQFNVSAKLHLVSVSSPTNHHLTRSFTSPPILLQVDIFCLCFLSNQLPPHSKLHVFTNVSSPLFSPTSIPVSIQCFNFYQSASFNFPSTPISSQHLIFHNFPSIGSNVSVQRVIFHSFFYLFLSNNSQFIPSILASSPRFNIRLHTSIFAV